LGSLSEEKQRALERIREKIYEDLTIFLEDIKSEKKRFSEEELTIKILDSATNSWVRRRTDLDPSNSSIIHFRKLIQSAIEAKSESEMHEAFFKFSLFLHQRDIFSAIDDRTNLELLINNLLPRIYLMNLQSEFTKIGIDVETTVNPDWNIALDDFDIYIEFHTPFGIYQYNHEKLAKYIDKDKVIPLKVDLLRKINTLNYRRERNGLCMDLIRNEDFEKSLLFETYSTMQPIDGGHFYEI
jgi:hypothetical protein